MGYQLLVPGFTLSLFFAVSGAVLFAGAAAVWDAFSPAASFLSAASFLAASFLAVSFWLSFFISGDVWTSTVCWDCWVCVFSGSFFLPPPQPAIADTQNTVAISSKLLLQRHAYVTAARRILKCVRQQIRNNLVEIV